MPVTSAQIIREFGGPSVMNWEELELPDPQPNEVQLRHEAVGVNAADTYHRAAISHPWQVPSPPCVIGFEGAGVIEKVGEQVSEFLVGDRVAYGIPPLGSYAERRNYPAEKLLRVPEGVTLKEAASIMMKGMTAHYLLHRTFKVTSEDTIVVHAAAGAMGLLLCQWASSIGATIVGTVSTHEKAELARAAGCDYPVVRSEQAFADVVRDVTAGEGASVVYEAIGKDTMAQSLDCLRPLGVCAAYGHVSGPPDPVDVIQDLGRRGSLFITRPAIMHYVAKRQDLVASGEAVFAAIQNKVIKPNIVRELSLEEAPLAHQLLESGQTVGSTILVNRNF
ncbi:MAG: quinone oxidoreductase [Betaproteobacteria bacterium]